jgi:hypothetical protein
MDALTVLHDLLDLLHEQTWIPTECAAQIAELRAKVEPPPAQ